MEHYTLPLDVKPTPQLVKRMATNFDRYTQWLNQCNIPFSHKGEMPNRDRQSLVVQSWGALWKYAYGNNIQVVNEIISLCLED